MNQYTIQNIECICCTGIDKVEVAIGSSMPEEYLCEFCIRGIALLHKDEEAEWIKVAMIEIPGNQRFPLPITSNDSKLEGIDINHRHVMFTDQVEVYEGTEDSEEQEIRSEINLKQTEGTGIPGFTLTRELMNTSKVKKLYDNLIETIQTNG